jgi:hypothetical protein
MSKSSDERLAAELRDSMRRTAPPRDVVQQAREAFAWRNVALAVAEIAYDSVVDADDDLARVRGVQAERRLTFQGPDAVVDMSVLDGGDRLVGNVRPASGGTVELRHSGGTETVAVDERGTFYFERVPRGAISVRFDPPGDASNGFVTEWVTI